MAAENQLTDARIRTATRERSGTYLADGGGLRVRILAPSAGHPRGAKLLEYHFKLKDAAGAFRHGAKHLGTFGEPFTDSTGETRAFGLADARRARDAARELVGRGIDPREAARLADADAAEDQRKRLAALDSRRTVRQAFKQWLALYLAKHRSDGGAYVEGIFERHVLPDLGDVPVDELRRSQITDQLDALVTAGLRRTANVVLSLLRQFTSWCIVREWITGADPTRGISKAAAGGKEHPRQRALNLDELVELRDKLPAAGLPARIEHGLWLVLATGCRIGELSGASVDEFDQAGAVWHIPAERTKTSKAHDVPLSAFALRHLTVLLELRGKSAWLIPSGRDDECAIGDKVVTKAVRDRMRLVPLKGRSKASAVLLLAKGAWTPHDLRRTLASRMRDTLGVPSDTVEKCIGHADASELVGTYQTGGLWSERVDAFTRWGAKLDSLLASRTGARDLAQEREVTV